MVAPKGPGYYVENLARFQKAMDRAKAQVADLTIPLTLIAKDFRKSQKSIFQLKGPGGFPDLSRAYKKEKLKAVGFVYPILVRSGQLRDSTTEAGHPMGVAQIVNKNTLLIGTKVPYAKKHQDGIGVPQRQFLFIGPESSNARSEQQGRLERWNNILNAYVLISIGVPVDSPDRYVLG